MTFEEEIPFYINWRNEPECKHSFQLTVNTNCPSVEIYMEQHDKAIRADERTRCVDEFTTKIIANSEESWSGRVIDMEQLRKIAEEMKGGVE